MQRFEQLVALEGADVLSAVELARSAQGQRVAKLQAPPAIGSPRAHVADAEPEPEPEPERFSEPIAVPVGPAIGFVAPGVDCRDESCGYVGMTSGGPAYVQTLETGELGTHELERFRLQFGKAVFEGKCRSDRGDAGSPRSSPGDAPDLPHELMLHDDSDGNSGYGSEDDKRTRGSESSDVVWRTAW